MSNADGLEKCRKENDPHSLMLRLSVCLFCTYTHSMLAFIFFAALRDQRYKLIHYSKDELSIQLSNVTVHDEGVYKCFYYGIPFKSKNKTVKVLGKFFHPLCPCFSTPDLPFCMQLHGAFTFLILVLAQSFPPPPTMLCMQPVIKPSRKMLCNWFKILLQLLLLIQYWKYPETHKEALHCLAIPKDADHRPGLPGCWTTG